MNLEQYNKLIIVKKSWETFKLNQSLSINANMQRAINEVTFQLTGSEPNWCCAESVIPNTKFVMDKFDDFEKTLSNPAKVKIDIKKVTR